MSKAHSNRLRIGRCSLQNQVYHVTSSTLDRQKFFESFYVARILIHAMQQESARGNVESLAFVVMPDHFHWLLQLKNEVTLSRTMSGVKANATRRINNFLGRQGTIWQKGYHDRALRSDEDVVQVARYIVANPIRGGIVKSCGEYSLWDASWI